MEGGRVKINCGMMVLIMVMLGMMVGQSDASFQQCLVRCVRTCFLDIPCLYRCATNCYLTDPPDVHVAAGATTNQQLCSLRCLATTLTRDRSTVLAESKKAGKEAVAEKLVERCSTTCDNKKN
ncbi:hypothetical protein LINPERHAP2_LOCUS37002 [Linum perenne]